MTKRKKRLEKGLATIEETICIHEQRKKAAHDEGDTYLEEYFDKEIEALTKRKQNREEMLGKQ